MKSTLMQQWDHWFFRKGPPHLLAVFRIVFGLFLLFYALTYAEHVATVFSAAGILLPLPGIPVPDPEVAYGLYVLLIVAIICFTIGFSMRTSILVILCIGLFFWTLSLHLFTTSYNRLFFFTLIVLLFSGADRTYSVAMRLEHGSFGAFEPISLLPQRLLALQITFTYLGVGWQKMVLPSWQGSEILTYSLIGRWGTPLGFMLIREQWPIEVWDAIVFLLKIFEFLLPVGLWVRQVRWWFFGGVALFLGSIALLLSIWWFLVLIPACILFLEPEAFRNFFRNRQLKS